MANILDLDSIWRAVSSPFAPFFGFRNNTLYIGSNPNTSQNQPHQQYRPPVAVSRPIAQPQPRTALQELQSYGINVQGMTEKDAQSYLPKERAYYQERQQKQTESNVAMQKVAQGNQETNMRSSQKEAEKQQTYSRLTAEKNQQADNLSRQLYMENAGYLNYLNQQAAYRNQQPPTLNIRFQ